MVTCQSRNAAAGESSRRRSPVLYMGLFSIFWVGREHRCAPYPISTSATPATVSAVPATIRGVIST